MLNYKTRKDCVTCDGTSDVKSCRPNSNYDETKLTNKTIYQLPMDDEAQLDKN